MIHRILALFALLVAFASPAFADTIATVDFQKALDQVNEAKTVKSNLEKMYGDRKTSLEKAKATYDAAVADYQKQEMLLSDSAKADKQKDIQQKGMQLQQMNSQYEGEMQQAYQEAMVKFIDKMKTISTQIAKEKSYTVLIEVNEGGIVYTTAVDITGELVKRYNAAQ